MKSVHTRNLGLEGEYPQAEVRGALHRCNDLGTELKMLNVKMLEWKNAQRSSQDTITLIVNDISATDN